MITLKYTDFRGGIVTCCLLLILLPACTPTVPDLGENTRPVGDGGFLSGEPCGPPCFVGIVPGVTREAEAIQILKTEGLCWNYTTFNNEPSGYRGFTCSPSWVGIAFRPGTDVVDHVGFPLSRIVMVGDVIARYGEPDAVLVAVSSQYPRTGMNLYYTHLQTILVLPEQEGATFWVKASTTIEQVSYYSTVTYRSRRPTVDSLPKWNGYGEYREYIPRE